ncbi:MAG: YfbM family protein [Janthinobacterium lividum]
MTGILRQLDEKKLEAFLSKPDEVLDFVDSDVPATDELDIEKAWHGLHFMLTGTAWEGVEPVCYLLSGGEQIGNEEEHDVGYGPARGIRASKVQNFANAISVITEQNFANLYDGQKMAALELYPRGWEEEPAEMQNWLTSSFNSLQEFVKQAAQKKKALLIYLQ